MTEDLNFVGGFTPESWEYARAFANSLGSLPSSFTSVVRLLMKDHATDPTQLSNYGRFFAGRLLKGPSMQAPYYYALQFLKPELLSDPTQPFGLNDFLNAFDGYEHAVLIGTILLHRQAKLLCDKALIDRLMPRLQRGLNLGWMVGNAMPSLGGGAGLLLGSFRVLGLFPFIKHDGEGFKKYWAHLQNQKLQLDINYEFQRWQCNSLQIGVMLCQILGFGLPHVIPLMRAATTSSPLLTSEEPERAFRVIDVWMESLVQLRSAPAIPLPPKYYPNKAELDDLISKVGEVLSDGPSEWFTKTKGDLTPETAPQLFLGSCDLEAPPSGEVPPEMSEEISEETVNQLSNQLLKDFLVDDDGSE